ncbi:hypothetical protein DTT79_26570, partial [Salmonella enterica subsp. enterica]|nr:hypothetical protein [Salmonella enterica subsp. enterica]
TAIFFKPLKENISSRLEIIECLVSINDLVVRYFATHFSHHEYCIFIQYKLKQMLVNFEG